AGEIGLRRLRNLGLLVHCLGALRLLAPGAPDGVGEIGVRRLRNLGPLVHRFASQTPSSRLGTGSHQMAKLAHSSIQLQTWPGLGREFNAEAVNAARAIDPSRPFPDNRVQPIAAMREQRR